MVFIVPKLRSHLEVKGHIMPVISIITQQIVEAFCQIPQKGK